MFAGLPNQSPLVTESNFFQTIATFQRNILQHCWTQHVGRAWPPCCEVLRHVGCCWLKFETGQIFHVIYQTRETVFHWDIQTPRTELKIRRAAEYFLTKFEVLDSRWNTVSSVWYLTNRMWLSVACTLIDNNKRHHSGQNVVDSRGAAEWVCNNFWPLWWRLSLSIRVHTTFNHIRFVFYHNIKHNEINLCLGSWKRLGFESVRAALCKWATCTHQTFLLKPFALICRNNTKKNVWKKSNEAYSLSIRVQTTINHISICFFLPQYQRQRNVFLQSASWKRYCVTRWRQQRGMDSHLPRQISQSDCEISSNCGKNMYLLNRNNN